jgi:transposase-like protein
MADIFPKENYFALIVNAVQNNPATCQFFQNKGLISKTKNCLCRSEMRLLPTKHYQVEFVWKFRGKLCRKTKSLKDGTFFEHSHLDLHVILDVIFLWSARTPVSTTAEILNITENIFIYSILQNSYIILNV